MPLRIAINGFGRIGRGVLRALYETQRRDDMQVVVINEPADLNTVVHLSKYDSTHGRFNADVLQTADGMRVNGDDIAVTHIEGLNHLDWSQYNVDLVLECSGRWSTKIELQQHIDAGAKRVLLSQPGEHDLPAIVFGVNEQSLAESVRIASAASCTTNAIVPVIDALDRAFGIEAGMTTTLHSVMNDQPVLDAYHNTDLRKTRAAGVSMIPVETELASGIARILPRMQGKFRSCGIRVPTYDVSAMQLALTLELASSVEGINQALVEAARLLPQPIWDVTFEPLASCDFIHDSRSGVVDAAQTRVLDKLVNILIWFDNEWGYANRMLDVAEYWFNTYPDFKE